METMPEPDSIYTEYHPSSGNPPAIKNIYQHNLRRFPNIVPDDQPWKPFRTRLDFEALEFAMDVGLNKEQMSHYIQLLHRTVECASNDDEKFTVENVSSTMRLWELAASLRVNVSNMYSFYSDLRTFFVIDLLVSNCDYQTAI
jgi:hypothetical protein